MNAQTGSAVEPRQELGLGAVLTDSLPAALLTPDAPERYTVAAVFTRRPSRPEIDAIHGAATRAALTDAGYPTVELRVSDRRLEMSNTNLEELAGGLAGVIAQQLHTISVKSAADLDRFDADVRERSQRETDRAALVALAAASVVFTRPSAAPSPESGGKGEGDPAGPVQEAK
jgi:hypothetical protein